MKIRFLVLAILLAVSHAAAAQSSFSLGYNAPGIGIGINVPSYPNLVRVPGYPVYYAPTMNSNYFFYDGMYWVYRDDDWYASSWYNGPWSGVSHYDVPLYVLRIPVRYYRQPPVYFRGWQRDDAPRWGEHWGRDWEQRRDGWNRWDRRLNPSTAPLPRYQAQYRGDRYPGQDQRHNIHNQQYRYQPKEPVVRDYYRQQPSPGNGLARERGERGERSERGGGNDQNRNGAQRPNSGRDPRLDQGANRNDRGDRVDRGAGARDDRANDRSNDRNEKNDKNDQRDLKDSKDPKHPR